MNDDSGRKSVNLNSLPPAKALMTMRIIWLALLLGPILFMGVIVLVILPQSRQTTQPQPILTWVSFALLAMTVPVAFVIRGIILRRSRIEDRIPTSAYSAANIIFWAASEGCALFALVVVMLNRSLWPTIVVAAIALCLQAITFPTGADLVAFDESGAAETTRN